MKTNENLIQFHLDEYKAREIICFSIIKNSTIYFINSKNNSFQPLNLGQLQRIQNSHPVKALIHLEEPNFVIYKGKFFNSNHEQYLSYLDFWLEIDFYKLFLSKTKICHLDVEPDNPNYAPELDIANIVYTAAIKAKKNIFSMKQKVKSLLDEMYPNLSSDSKKRIIMITNTVVGKKPGRKKKI